MYLQYFILAFVLKIVASEVCTPPTELKLLLLKGNVNSLDTIPLSDILSLSENSNFNETKNSMIYAFGFNEVYDSVSVQTVVKAYLSRNDTNIFVLDWSKYNVGNYYLDALDYVVAVGQYLGRALVKLSQNGFDMKKFHLVGHSLGGQVMGYAGRTAAAEHLNISRITGLDPAGPGFFPLNVFLIPLNSKDADFVDIIHTDMYLLGANASTGHADFWPNGGHTEPGCPPFDPSLDPLNTDNLCNHWRSWEYYAESVPKTAPLNTFKSVKCNTWNDFTSKNCQYLNKNGISHMGYHAIDNKSPGNFYLQTNGQGPFSRGEKGIRFSRV